MYTLILVEGPPSSRTGESVKSYPFPTNHRYLLHRGECAHEETDERMLGEGRGLVAVPLVGFPGLSRDDREEVPRVMTDSNLFRMKVMLESHALGQQWWWMVLAIVHKRLLAASCGSFRR